MKIAYIAHPIGGNVKENLEKIIKIVRDINLKEPMVVLFAHYWVDCHALDDNIEEERERGIKNDREFFFRKSFDELRLYGDRISKGMKAEILLALSLNIPVIGMTDETKRGLANIFNDVLKIPCGIYCYNKDYRCPHHEIKKDKPSQEDGYCHLLEEGDWESKNVSLLWDSVKECGLNDEE